MRRAATQIPARILNAEAPLSTPCWVENPTAVIEQVFNAIAQDSMEDFPLVNSALSVEAVACRLYRFANGVASWLTVLITPWSMNLMLLPSANGKEPWPETAPGGKYRWQFPSGVYEFTVAQANGLGLYHLCSLFSPPTEFASQQLARQTACATLVALTQNEPKRQQKPVNAASVPDAVNTRRAFLGLGNWERDKG